MKDLNNEHSDQNCNQERRNFLAGSGKAIAGMTLVPGVILMGSAQAKPLDQAVSSDKRWGMLIDTAKCGDGCTSCVDACAEENGLLDDEHESNDQQKAHWIRKVTLKSRSTGKVQSLPLLCQHCESAPCVDVCPTGASFRREDGIVLVDKHICIGCRYCMMACPYKARSFVHEDLFHQKSYAPRGKGTVESCTMCVHRVDSDRTPACVEACSKDNHQAMIFGDLKDPNSELSKALLDYSSRQIREDLNLNTGVRYRNI